MTKKDLILNITNKARFTRSFKKYYMDTRINFSDLFTSTQVNTSVRALSRLADESLPFKTYSENMVWVRDKSIGELLKKGAPITEAHSCCALDTTREATITEIISGLGGLHKVFQHLYAYQNIGSLPSPSYRRFEHEGVTIKKEMNLFFTLGRDENLCIIGIYFDYALGGKYYVFAREVISKELYFKKNKEIFPTGTRIFFKGSAPKVFENKHVFKAMS